MSFYTELADTSLEMLTEFGQDVTRTTNSEGTYDPSTGAVTQSTASTTRKGAAFPFSGGVTQIRGSLIQSGDIQLFLDAEGSVAITDRYTIGSTVYGVVSYEEYSPAGTAVLYALHLRVL